AKNATKPAPMMTNDDPQNALPALQERMRPGLQQLHARVVQDVVRRLQKALDAFFPRLKEGATPGSPRFRGKGRYHRLPYSPWDNGGKLSATRNRLILAQVG